MSAFYIPKPCHENWNHMTPQEQGRHCAVCSKVVVDFTKKTQDEVANVMANADGRVCGNFNLSQLDAKAQMKVFKNPFNVFNKNWKYFAMSVFGLFAINKKMNAQNDIKNMPLRGMVAPSHNTNTQVSTITGTVTDPSGNRLVNANVILTSNGKELANLQTDADGKYLVKIEPGNIDNKKISVRVHHFYYESKAVEDLYISKHVTTLNIQMESEIMMMGIVQEVYPVDTVKPELPIAPDTTKIKDDIIQKNSVLEQDTTKINTLVVTDSTNKKNEKEIETPVNNLVIRPEDITASIYPNPSGTFATVFCNTPNNYKIDVYSLSGALQQSHSFNGDRLKLDVSKLERGTYFVRVNDETGTLNTLKLIKN